MGYELILVFEIICLAFRPHSLYHFMMELIISEIVLISSFNLLMLEMKLIALFLQKPFLPTAYQLAVQLTVYLSHCFIALLMPLKLNLFWVLINKSLFCLHLCLVSSNRSSEPLLLYFVCNTIIMVFNT